MLGTGTQSRRQLAPFYSDVYKYGKQGQGLPDRPLNKAEDRAAVLAGLASVALVTFFYELTPVELIKKMKLDLYVKGDDYGL